MTSPKIDYAGPVSSCDARPMTSAAKRQEANENSAKQELVHEVLSSMSFEEMLNSVYAHIEARPNKEGNADPLMEFANKVGRVAWKHV